MAYNVKVKEYDDEATKLFRNIMYESNDVNDKYVMDKCVTIEGGPLYLVTIQRSTVLHLVCYFERFDLASKLLNMIQENDCLSQLIKTKNYWGSTILHDAASATDKTDEGIAFIEELLQKVPMLLPERNKLGETAVFSAVRYGNKPMFNALMHKVKTFCNQHYQYTPLDFLKRSDDFTVLHLAIITRQFDLAFQIAKEHEDIRNIPAINSVKKSTALQMLGRSRTAFESGTELGRLTKIFYESIDFEDVDLSVSVDTTHDEGFLNAVDRMQGVGIIGRAIKCISRRWKIPYIKRVIDLKMENVYARELAELLIGTDEYWDKPLLDEDDYSDKPLSGEGEAAASYHPLFLAARNNCKEMFKNILQRHPQAVDYLNPITRENLLHIAVKSRNRDVIDYVIKKRISLKGQLIAVDNYDNCLLHMVGCRPARRRKKKTDEGREELSYQPINHEDPVDKEIKSPVTDLSEELKFKEYIEDKCPPYMRSLRNKNDMTADELFAYEKEDLRIEAKEYLKTTSEHCTVVIVLIATVAFASAYTVPGGPNDQTGHPLLLQNPQTNPLFIVFTVTDVLSLGFGLTAVILFLTILTSGFKLKDFKTSLPRRLLIGLSFLFLSVLMMMISFAATIIITIQSKKKWTNIALYIVAFIPALVFMLSYVNFLKEFRPFIDIFSKIGKALPRPVKRKSKTRDHHTSSFNTV